MFFTRSSRSRSNKSKWVDSKKSTSFAAESEVFIEYDQKEEDDAVSIHEDDLMMKLKTIDETTEGQGQGDNEVDKPISTSTGTASTAGSSRSLSNKLKWVDSKKSTSFAAESEVFIEYDQKEEDDAVSIHEGDDLVMKLKTIDETTEGQGQGDNEVDKPISTSTGTASTAGSSCSRSNKSKWVDSKKSTSLAAESDAFIEYDEKKEDAVSIHEGGDLEMKLKIIDETTEGQGQGDNEVDKPVAVANASFEASTSAEGARDEEEKGKDDDDKQETDPCDVDEEQAKEPVMPTSTATAFVVQSDDKADNGKDTANSEGN